VWAGAALLAVLGLGLMLNFAWHGSITVARTEQLRQSIARTTDRPLYPEIFETIPLTPRENMETMKTVWRRPTYVPAQVEGLLLFGPTVAVLSWATLLLLRRWIPGRWRRVYAGVLIATLAPLSLHLVGWDNNRWNELLCLNAFLLLLMVSRMAGDRPVQLPVRLRRVCLLVMLLNMAAGGGMVDGSHIRPFPFLRSPDAVVTDAATTHP
jgi:hypothetical protein